jgi:GH24 family phage-related lysozyme (muramidase)
MTEMKTSVLRTTNSEWNSKALQVQILNCTKGTSVLAGAIRDRRAEFRLLCCPSKF